MVQTLWAELKIINVEDSDINKLFFNRGTVWRFSPPHNSHMGGVWQRMNRTVKSILDSILSVCDKNLIREVLATFVCMRDPLLLLLGK